MQGSVEVTSFGKMNNILTYGRYRVGTKNTQTVRSIHDMIHLKLENTGKQLPQNNFSLDDLRELESKLVLITGSRAENRKEVDQFLNVSDRGCTIVISTSYLLHFCYYFSPPTSQCRLFTVSLELQRSC